MMWVSVVSKAAAKLGYGASTIDLAHHLCRRYHDSRSSIDIDIDYVSAYTALFIAAKSEEQSTYNARDMCRVIGNGDVTYRAILQHERDMLDRLDWNVYHATDHVKRKK